MAVLARRRSVVPRRGSVAGAFSPISIAGLQVWLKADAITGLANGDPVAAWSDSSGNGNGAAQATTSKRPTFRSGVSGTLNAQPLVRFDGVDDFLQTAPFASALAQPGMAFWVGKYAAGSATQFFMDGITATDRWAALVNYPSLNTLDVYAGANTSPLALSSGNYFLLTVLWNGVNSLAWTNGTAGSTVSAGANSVTGLTLGAHYSAIAPLNGDVAEVIVYNSALSSSDRAQVWNYLNNKYALY